MNPAAPVINTLFNTFIRNVKSNERGKDTRKDPEDRFGRCPVLDFHQLLRPGTTNGSFT